MPSVPKLLYILIASAALFACTTGGESLPPAAPPVQPEQSKPAIAFEPIVGIPEERATVLAHELGSGAVERDLDVVAREGDEAEYRVKGYITAETASSETVVTYVWDVFHADGSRAHRIEGTERIGAAVPDPWQAVTDDALRKIGRRTIVDLADWLASAPGGGRGSATAATSASAMTTSQAVSAGPLTPGAGAANGTRFGVYVQPAAGAAGDGATALANALARELAAQGGAPSGPTEADYRISAEATVGPPHKGRQTVAIIWSVTDAGGETLGTVRQVNKVPEGSLDAAWGSAAERAAAAAAPGILALVDGG